MTGVPSTFEQRLIEALECQRPDGGAPTRLRARVLEIPSRAGRRGWLAARGRRMLIGGAVAAAAVLGALTVRLGPLAPSAVSPGASGPGIDPMVEGPEVITALLPTLPLVGWGLAVILTISAIGIGLRGRHDRRRLVAAGLVGLAAVGAGGLAVHPGPGVGGWNGYGPSLGFRQVNFPDITDEEGNRISTLIASAAPGQPFAFFFVVHNPGPLTVRLEGIREDEGAMLRIAPRWTALGLAPDVHQVGGGIQNAVPFHPIDIPAEGDIGLLVIGKASPCTIGAAPLADHQAFAVRGPDIDLVYSVFGLTNTATYHMPVVIEEPLIDGCTG